MSQTKLKPFPSFASNEEAERFVDEADLSEYDMSGFKPVSIVKRDAGSLYSLSLPSELLYNIDAKARALGVSIDDYLIDLIEKDLGQGTDEGFR